MTIEAGAEEIELEVTATAKQGHVAVPHSIIRKESNNCNCLNFFRDDKVWYGFAHKTQEKKEM